LHSEIWNWLEKFNLSKIYIIKFSYRIMDYERRKEEYIPQKLYEKPVIKKLDKMNFPLEILASATGEKILCKQCSSCHNCR